MRKTTRLFVALLAQSSQRPSGEGAKLRGLRPPEDGLDEPQPAVPRIAGEEGEAVGAAVRGVDEAPVGTEADLGAQVVPVKIRRERRDRLPQGRGTPRAASQAKTQIEPPSSFTV